MTNHEPTPMDAEETDRRPTVWDKVMILGVAGLAIGGMVLMCVTVLVIIWLR